MAWKWFDAHRRSDRRGSTLAVAIGGAVGVAARYEIGLHWGASDPSAFPWATLCINLVGACALGLMVTVLSEYWSPKRFVRPLVGVGFLGGFTTFSTFAVESARLTQEGSADVALLYVAVSLVGGILAVLLGIGSGGALLRMRGERTVKRSEEPA